MANLLSFSFAFFSHRDRVTERNPLTFTVFKKEVKKMNREFESFVSVEKE
jgi:hypothetical protein